MHKLGTAMLIAAGVLVSPVAANAQSWSRYGQNDGRGYDREYRQSYRHDRVESVCSGERAHSLEAELRQQYQRGQIDGRSAERLQAHIDGLERQQRQECAERDWRTLQSISFEYDGIAKQIEWQEHRRWRGGRRGY